LSARNNTLQLSAIENSGNAVVDIRSFYAALDAAIFDVCLKYLGQAETRDDTGV